MLKKAYPDKRIIMTRSTDVFLTLQERTEIANNVKLGENEAVLYISVHVNASLDKKAKGFEVWYLTPGYRRTVLDSNTTSDPQLFKILNEMMEIFRSMGNSTLSAEEKLKEFVGHTKLQVAMGGLLGVVIAVLLG